MQVLVGVQCSHPSARRGQRPNGAGEKKKARNTVHTTCDAGCVRPTPAAARRCALACSVSLDSQRCRASHGKGSRIESICSVVAAHIFLVARRAKLPQFALAIRVVWVDVALGLGAPMCVTHCALRSPWSPLSPPTSNCIARRSGRAGTTPDARRGLPHAWGGSTGRRSGSTPKP